MQQQTHVWVLENPLVLRGNTLYIICLKFIPAQFIASLQYRVVISVPAMSKEETGSAPVFKKMSSPILPPGFIHLTPPPPPPPPSICMSFQSEP